MVLTNLLQDSNGDAGVENRLVETVEEGETVKVAKSCPRLSVTPWTTQSMEFSRNSPGQSTGVGSLSLLQGIFPTQGSNPGLPHCRQTLHQLSHRGSPEEGEGRTN